MVTTSPSWALATSARKATVGLLLLVFMNAGADAQGLAGTVVDATTGDALAGARVRYYPLGRPPRDTVTDAHGVFLLAVEPPGTLVVNAPGFAVVRHTWAAGTGTRLRIPLSRVGMGPPGVEALETGRAVALFGGLGAVWYEEPTLQTRDFGLNWWANGAWGIGVRHSIQSNDWTTLYLTTTSIRYRRGIDAFLHRFPRRTTP